jgi:hypothetical protein
MPAAQGEVTNREIRFTLRFRRTITIAATSASSSFVIGPAQHAAHAGFQQTIRHRVASATIREHRGVPELKFASDDAPEAQAEAKPPGPANDPYELREISAPDALASAIGALQRKLAFRGMSTPRRNEGVGEHVRTRFHSGLLAPVKLRIVKDTRTERRKACFFCRTGFERAGLF